MYQNYMNKPTFMANSSNPTFGASTSTFGQPPASSTMFSSMQPSNIFQTPSTSSFNSGPATQSTFGTNLFGQQPQPSTSSLFGSSNAFGQNKATFGFGSTPSQTGLFGQQPQQQTGTTLFQSNTSNLFGSGAFGNQTTGTVIKFAPVTGTDTMQKNGVAQSISTKHHCITCMKEYESKSLEELRFEDYSVNRKGPQQQPGFGSTPFGASTTGASTSLFGQTDNKQAFNQQSSFVQPAFGQATPAFGVTNPTSTPNLFGKPNTFGTTTSSTPSFGFNATPSTSNPFSATQTQKPFSQPLFGSATTQSQPTFGATNVFGQTNTQSSATNLFQKPAQPATGFNTGQQGGFSFNQPATTQSSNLFQAAKPASGFGIFGQTNTTPQFGQTTQPTFGTNFGKLTQPTFSQPSQSTFGTNLSGGLQQQSLLFGNTANKPPSLFGTTTSGGNLFNNNAFQQTPNSSFSLNVNQQQQAQFPPEPSDDAKNVSLLATDIFADGPHVYGLEPVLSDANKSTTNPKDLKVLLESSKERDEAVVPSPKIKVQLPKPKRGNNYNREFFETNQAMRSSHKCLVIRKFNENPSTIYNKYRNELLEEAEEVLRAQSETADSSSIMSPRSNLSDIGDYTEKITDYKGRPLNLRLQLDSSITDETDEARTYDESTTFTPLGGSSKTSLTESKSSKITPRSGGIGIQEEEATVTEIDATSIATTSESENFENPAGVVLTRPEYYIYPALKDLHQYMDETGACIVQGLTIGRRGYGNVYFPDPIDIANMNLDEIVHFRHREVIIYPDDSKKPPVGEGLNRRAQVTLDKIFPRDKETKSYITDVNHIIQSNFVDNLMHITQKHDSRFVDYRPKTGSWVFKVKHFSKYAFTESDEEECEITVEKGMLPKKPQEVLKKDEAEDTRSLGLGGQISKSRLLQESDMSVSESTVGLRSEDDEEMYVKSSLFTNLGSTSSQETLKKVEEVKDVAFGLGGRPHVSKSRLLKELEISGISVDESVELWPEGQYTVTEEMYHTDSAIQTLKSSLFTNLESTQEMKQPESVIVRKQDVPVEVITTPKIHKLPDLSILIVPEKVTTTQRVYTELGIFKCNTYKVGWKKGFDFYSSDPVADNEVIYGLNVCNIGENGSRSYNSMMPNLVDMLNVTLGESEFSFDKNQVPTLRIKGDLSYLQKQTNLFNDHVRKHTLTGREKYLCSVWNLCFALWGPGDNSPFSRRQYLSDWLKRFSYDLSDEWGLDEMIHFDEIKAFKLIYKLLSFYKIPEACEIASKQNFNRLSLLISQISANERYKFWMQKHLNNFVWREKDIVVDDFKKLYLLLAGIPVYENINTCDDLDWMRSFGAHLWYIAPAAAPIDVAFYLYKKAFEELEYATKPVPPYCDSTSQTTEYDLLYHILGLYVDGTYQLCKVLHPETHTESLMDYRLSWFMLQLFQSLNVGLIRDSEKEHLHTTFATQLENMGEWKWAIFTLLFLENNLLKKNLITQILNRNASAFSETSEIEGELVKTFKIPPSWIHEVKAIKTKSVEHYYDYFQHCIYMEDWQHANTTFVDHILPELFVNGQLEYLMTFIKKLEPVSNLLMNWQNQVGLIKDYLDLEEALCGNTESMTFSGGKLNSLFRRINSFPVKNDLQKLCVAELSRRCALLFKILHKNLGSQTFQDKFVDVLSNLVMPPDIKHFEIFYLISKYVNDDSAKYVTVLD